MKEPQHLVVGPEQHGVVEYALRLSDELGITPLRFETAAELEEALSLDFSSGVHLCFTDHLWGENPQAAVERVERVAGGAPLSISFHDIPQPQEGAERFQERAGAYLRLGELADVVTVNSQHEAGFFAEQGSDVRPVVIPLPLPQPVLSQSEREKINAEQAQKLQQRLKGSAGASGAERDYPQLAVMGFLYPGKGHRELIESLAGTGACVRALGGVSAGHDDLVDELNDAAHRAGVKFSVTGFLPEEELERHMLATEIPVCAHRHFSASGSLMKWISLGRRVLVADTAYSRELADRWGDFIVLVADDRWRQAVEHLSADFALATEPPTDWTWRDVAAAFQAEWADSLD